MFTLTPRHPLATLAVVAGLLIAAAPAGAAGPPKSICAFPDVCILYNGHAGLGAN
jgi:hypothetical protein